MIRDKYPKHRFYIPELDKLLFIPEYMRYGSDGGRMCIHTYTNNMDCSSIECHECFRNPDNKIYSKHFKQ